MPYYIFQIKPASNAIVKPLNLVTAFEHYREAKAEIRKLRSEQAIRNIEYKMIFAESELEAESLLQEKREAPILMEWEK